MNALRVQAFSKSDIQTSTLSLQLYDYRHVYLDAYALALELFTTIYFKGPYIATPSNFSMFNFNRVCISMYGFSYSSA